MLGEEVQPRGNGIYQSVWQLFYPVLILLIFASCSFRWISFEVAQVFKRYDRADRDREADDPSERAEHNLKKKGYEFPMKVGAYSCESHSDAKNMLKAFETKYQLELYEVVRPMFDPNGYARDVLQIGSVSKHVTTVEDYWADYRDELESKDCAFVRLTVEQIKTYGINFDVEGLEDDGQNMYSNTYLTKLRGIPISLVLYVDVEENFDIMMARIIKRMGKWVEWTTKRSQSKGGATQASPAAATPSSQSATPGITIVATQGLAQPSGGGDQPPDKNVSIAKTCHDGSLPVIGTQIGTEEKKNEEPKDSIAASVPSPYVPPVPSPHVSPD